MSQSLEEYKRQQISYLTNTYNQAVNSINTKYTGLLNQANRIMNRRSKTITINNIILSRTNELKNLYNQYIQNVRKINSLTVVPGPKKYALLISSNYPGTQYQLNGCLNDSQNIQNLLTTKYGYNNITLLNDNVAIKPTKSNIINSLTNILRNANSGDTVVLFYSGHGTYTIDRNGDELDGKDEMICPSDMNFISDDELNSLLKQNLKSGVTIISLFDCCFSGTILDLRYNYLDSLNLDKLTINLKEPDLSNNKIIMISGCNDNQTSADAFINGKFAGAMTFAFLTSLENNNYSINYKDLITNMRKLLNDNGYTQLPQLSSSVNIDLTSEKVCF